MERKGVLVSRICRDPAVAFCLDFLIFSLRCCSGRFNDPKCGYLTSWDWDSTINRLCWCVQEQLGQILLILPFKLNSLWIILIWRELQLALQKNGRNVLQRDTFFCDTLYTFQSLYYCFYLSTKAAKATKVCPLIKNMCTFATTRWRIQSAEALLTSNICFYCKKYNFKTKHKNIDFLTRAAEGEWTKNLLREIKTYTSINSLYCGVTIWLTETLLFIYETLILAVSNHSNSSRGLLQSVSCTADKIIAADHTDNTWVLSMDVFTASSAFSLSLSSSGGGCLRDRLTETNNMITASQDSVATTHTHTHTSITASVCVCVCAHRAFSILNVDVKPNLEAHLSAAK